MKLKDLIPGVFVVALVGALAFLWLSPSGIKAAPEISLTTLDGTTINLAEKQGKPYLVTFWATTCPGCIKEMPHFVELYNEYSPRGFDVIGIAVKWDPPNQVAAMREAKQIPYPIVVDAEGQFGKAFGGVQVTPTTFLVGRDGRILQQKLGEMDIDDLRKKVEALL